MATDVWQVSSRRWDLREKKKEKEKKGKILLGDSESWDEWEDAAAASVLCEVSCISEGCIAGIIKPQRTSPLAAANRAPPAVSMVTVALDCYYSNSTTGNSLQPWSLGGKTLTWCKWRTVWKGMFEKIFFYISQYLNVKNNLIGWFRIFSFEGNFKETSRSAETESMCEFGGGKVAKTRRV